MDLAHLEDQFVDIGGEFRRSAFDIRETLEDTRAFIWDWDGVFNDGRKVQHNSSNYSVIDGLGTNMLRFGYFLKHRSMPVSAIITGEENPMAIDFARQQNFDAIYVGVKKKQDALDHLLKNKDLQNRQLAYFFDDVLDLPVAQRVGLRFAVKRDCNPLFNRYLVQHEMADYISGNSGSQHAVREFCELLLCLMDQYQDVLEHRSKYDDFLQDYQQQQAKHQCMVYEFDGNSFVQKQLSQ